MVVWSRLRSGVVRAWLRAGAAGVILGAIYFGGLCVLAGSSSTTKSSRVAAENKGFDSYLKADLEYRFHEEVHSCQNERTGVTR